MFCKFIKKLLFTFTICLVITAANTESAFAAPILTQDKILFDAEFYEQTYPELAGIYGSGFEAMYRHYLEHGREEGRLPYAGAEMKTQVVFYDAPETTAELPDKISINQAGKNIYVGDSRTYIMHQAIGNDGNSWIGFPGTSYDVFSTAATAAIDKIDISNKNIVILYGINDIMGKGAAATFNEYNFFLKTKAQEWIRKGAKVYFVNLCGVNDELTNTISTITPDTVKRINNDTAKFNKMMKSFPKNIRKINAVYGKNPEYDGIHYTPETCMSVYKQINSCLR